MDGDNQLASPFRWYEPSLTGMFQKNILKVKSMNERIAVDRPVWIVTWENNIHLPKHWLANIEYSYQSPGSIQWFTFREEHNLNISLSKTFLNEKLQSKTGRQTFAEQTHEPI